MQSRWKFLRLWKLIERENAVRYMLLSLMSFVATVSVVRSFLALTGYPQIGNATLHIAHVLWGGLILYIAAILPLIYLNPKLHLLGAVLSGVGVGLFIDEVGKLITRQYDYFFPAAAPIIYIFFLLLVIMVVMIRRPDAMDGRAELVQALEVVREQLYRPLEPDEKTRIEQDMRFVLDQDADKLHQEMARRLLELVKSDPRVMPVKSPGWAMRIVEQSRHWWTEARLTWFLGVGMAILCLVTLKNPLQFGLERFLPGSSLLVFFHAHSGREIAPAEAPFLFDTRLVLEVLISLFLLLAVLSLALGKKRLATSLGNISLLLSLLVLDMLLFYFEQFSTALTVAFQFLLLFGVMYYRRNFLPSSKN